MSIANKRAFLAAAQALVKTNEPQMEHFEAVTAALAQVFTDTTGVECQVVMKANVEQLKEVLKAHGI